MKTKIKMPVAPEAEFAKFASVAKVTHSAFEFYLDFGQFLPEDKSFKTHTRLVITPLHAKRIAKVLADSVVGYEKKFGKVPEIKVPKKRRVELKKPAEPGYIG